MSKLKLPMIPGVVDTISLENFNIIKYEGNNDPLIHDLELADKLGFERKADIRKVINTHKRILERKFGKIVVKNSKKSTATTFLLNSKQAIFIANKIDYGYSDETIADIINMDAKYRMMFVINIENTTNIQLTHNSGIAANLENAVTQDELYNFSEVLLAKIKDMLFHNFLDYTTKLEKDITSKYVATAVKHITHLLPTLVKTQIEVELKDKKFVEYTPFSKNTEKVAKSNEKVSEPIKKSAKLLTKKKL